MKSTELSKLKEKKDKSEKGKNAIISINGDEKKLKRGKYTVIELKNLADIPLAHDLEQIINGKMTLLPDNGEVKIKGGEVFVSHPKDGGSS